MNTICAISTAAGGAIGTIRVSGDEAISITDHIFKSASGKPLADKKAYTVSFGTIVDGEDVVDEVLVSLFRAPHSYTGEDSIEISCHGSQYILQKVVELLIRNGASAAKPGEFTQRAFLNGKLDLSQAEAVADIIASTNRANHRMAMNQMRGCFSRKLSSLRDQLLKMTSLIELELDFSEEDVEFADRQELRQIATDIKSEITILADSFQTGQAIKNGIPVAIIGETNAGKSTLLNQLLGEERAIVSDIHGTTRDVIEDTININGITFRFIDTAGIRETSDTIESIGIERTFNKIKQSSIVLWIVDPSMSQSKFKELHDKILPLSGDKKLLLLLNKCDMQLQTTITIPSTIDTLTISAKQGMHLDSLRSRLVELAAIPEFDQNQVIVSNARHFEALINASNAISMVIDGLSSNLPGDLIAQDLRQCLFHLAEILGGEITTDEVLGNIFKNFCVGK